MNTPMDEQKAYFDVQVNGYGGVCFQQDELSAEEFHRACERLLSDGVTLFLPTIVTADLGKMEGRVRRIVELRERDPLALRMIPGIHIEGPFLSPVEGYRGAHLPEAIRPADQDGMQRLVDAGGGLVRLVTLAPEVDAGLEVVRRLAKMGIRVSAGHTNASVEELKAAIDAGLSMFTHLGNGCPMYMHRHDNIIQRALALCERLWLMFIADGAHVAFPALGNYLRMAGIERCIVVTDANSPAGQGPGRFRFGRWDLEVGEDLVLRSPDGKHLVGSAVTMSEAVRRLVEQVGLTREQALRLTVHNPRLALDIDQ
jgi:N-acetylglucosamine-6-phosphate deacetylase